MNLFVHKILLILVGFIPVNIGFSQVINNEVKEGTIACPCITDTTNNLFIDFNTLRVTQVNDKTYQKINFIFDDSYEQTLLIRKEGGQLLATTKSLVSKHEKDQVLVDFNGDSKDIWEIKRLPLFQFGNFSVDSVAVTSNENIFYIKVSQYLQISHHIKVSYLIAGDKSGIISFYLVDERRFGEQYICEF